MSYIEYLGKVAPPRREHYTYYAPAPPLTASQLKCAHTPDAAACNLAAVVRMHNLPLPRYRDTRRQLSAMVGWADPSTSDFAVVHDAGPDHVV